MLYIDKLNFRYGSGTPVLNNISMGLNEGILCGLFGPNGCGKTTLFKCCLKFLRPQNGSIRLNGTEIQHLKVREMAKLAAYVPQDHKTPFPFRVYEIVLMGRTPYMEGFFALGRHNRQKAEEALDLLGISDLVEQPYTQLSGGQRQLVLIARAIAQEARVIFLDEPTSALDFDNQIKIWNVLRRVANQGITILACCHDPNHVVWFCDKVIVMNRSGIIANGSPQTALRQEILDQIYHGACRVVSVDDMNVILPANNRLKGGYKHVKLASIHGQIVDMGHKPADIGNIPFQRVCRAAGRALGDGSTLN